jgi:hypothetical protein
VLDSESQQKVPHFLSSTDSIKKITSVVLKENTSTISCFLFFFFFFLHFSVINTQPVHSITVYLHLSWCQQMPLTTQSSLQLTVSQSICLGVEPTVCSAITQWPESLRTCNHILLSHLSLPQPGGPGSRIYIPHEQGGPDITLGTGFPLHRLLHLAGLQLRYSNPPPHGNVEFNEPQCLLYVTNLSLEFQQKTQVSCNKIKTISNSDIPIYTLIFLAKDE